MSLATGLNMGRVSPAPHLLEHEEGECQSPIDIRHTESHFDPELSESSIVINWRSSDLTELVNTGFNWRVDVAQAGDSTFEASHLPGKYKLAQFHCHWGSNPWNGSEHVVLGRGHAAEMHFVHYNTNYGSFDNACKAPAGLAVLGIFLDEDPLSNDNPDLLPLTQGLEKIRGAVGSKIRMSPKFDPMKLLPAQKNFWTYEGSLTTKPYTECVLWTILRQPIAISYGQLQRMRCITPSNIRPLQKAHDRVVRSSFELGGRVSTMRY